MEEDEDDFYSGGGASKQNSLAAIPAEDDKDDHMDVSEEGEEEEEEEEDESDDDIQFTLEKPEGVKSEPAASSKQRSSQHERPPVESKRTKSSTPAQSEAPRAGSTAPQATLKGTLTHNGKEGKDFPESRTSKLDVDATPSWPANGKPITEVDIDADLAENSKAWRLPGTDITDFFNYGFDEYTWTQYCVRQQMMSNTLTDLKQQDAQMKAFFGGGPGSGPGGGGHPAGMPGMPPGMQMPTPDQLEMAVQQGLLPPEAAQQMMGMMQGMAGNMGQQAGYGSGQNSASPLPQPGQGFQPPSGPSAQQGFQGGNMEGFSPQQLAIMQQEQGGQYGNAGGRSGRKGRGRW